MGEVKKIPELRFPEFEGNWRKTRLGDIGKVTMCRRIMKDQTTQTGDIPFYKIGTFGKTADAYIERELFENYKKKYSYPNEGDILIAAAGATYGKTVEFNGYPSYFQDSNIVWIDNNEELVSNKFLHICYKKINWAIEESTIPRLYNSIISSASIFTPTLPEQTQIANFLTTVDERINLLTQQKEKLEQYKKGVMQRIFNQQLRFKDDDGKEFPEWEEKRLGEICHKKASNISANSLEGSDGIYKIYGATGFLQNVDFFREEEPYISIVKDGAGVGRILLCKAKSSVLGTLDIIKPKQSINLEFLFSILSRVSFKKYVTGSTIPHIYFKDYSKEKVLVPILKEQQKIASFLSAIDKKIELVNQQIEQTKTWKKGLLQKMFV